MADIFDILAGGRQKRNEADEGIRRRRAELLGDVGRKRDEYQAKRDEAVEAVRARAAEAFKQRDTLTQGATPVRPPAVSPFGNPRGIMAIMRPQVNPNYDPTAPIGQRGAMYVSPEGAKGFFSRLVGNNADELNYAQQQAEQSYLQDIGRENVRSRNALENAFLTGDVNAAAQEYADQMRDDRSDVRNQLALEAQAAQAEEDRVARARLAAQQLSFAADQERQAWERNEPIREAQLRNYDMQYDIGKRELSGPRAIGQDIIELGGGELYRQTPMLGTHGLPIGMDYSLMNVGRQRTGGVWSDSPEAPAAMPMGAWDTASPAPEAAAPKAAAEPSILEQFKDKAKTSSRLLDTGRYLMGQEPEGSAFIPTRTQAWLRAIINAGREY